MNQLNTKYNEENEKAKYEYFEYLGHRKTLDSKTVDQAMKAIHEFEVVTHFKDFRKYDSEWAKSFKYHLDNKKNASTGRNISKSLYNSYVNSVRKFFEWLVEDNDNYRKIKKRHIDYLRVTRNDANKARAVNFQKSYDVQDVLSTIRSMPDSKAIERRDLAILSLWLLVSPRLASLQSARIKSLVYFKDYDMWSLMQNPNTHNTKFSKNIQSLFMGQSQDIIDNVIVWRDFLIEQGFGDNDYLFPRIRANYNSDEKHEACITKEPIKSPDAFRSIFKKAFLSNNMEYIKPHNIRHCVSRRAAKLNNTSLMIALSENLGHRSKMPQIMSSYGQNYMHTQAKLMKEFLLE